MRFGLVSCAVVLCALPAAGDNALLTPPVIRAIASIDSLPSKAVLDDAFGAQAALGNLLLLARDQTIDLGIELRAIRALPEYCPPAPQPCAAGAAVHDALAGLVVSLAAAQLTPQDLLRLRAAVEALGVTRSALATDVDLLMTVLRGNASRDVRATTVRALGNLCSSAAIDPLSGFYLVETSPQVKAAIMIAVQNLRKCAS